MHSMVLVHESLYRSENLARVNFAEYAQTLATDIMSSHGSLSASIRLKSELEPIVMNVDLAIPCGLILNELISNALKHGFSNGTGGEIKMTLRHGQGYLHPRHRGQRSRNPGRSRSDGAAIAGAEAGAVPNQANSGRLRTGQYRYGYIGAIEIQGGSLCPLIEFLGGRAR